MPVVYKNTLIHIPLCLSRRMMSTYKAAAMPRLRCVQSMSLHDDDTDTALISIVSHSTWRGASVINTTVAAWSRTRSMDVRFIEPGSTAMIHIVCVSKSTASTSMPRTGFWSALSRATVSPSRSMVSNESSRNEDRLVHLVSSSCLAGEIS